MLGCSRSGAPPDKGVGRVEQMLIRTLGQKPYEPCGKSLTTKDRMRALEGPGSDLRMLLLAGGDGRARRAFPEQSGDCGGKAGSVGMGKGS